MYALYLLSVWIHILAATVWIGGMLFLVLVMVPWLRLGGGDAAAVLRETGVRFRSIGWICFLLAASTGTFNLWFGGVRPADFVRAEWLASPYGKTVVVKLGAFLLVLAVSAVHDFVVGPRAVQAISEDPTSPRSQRERRRASALGRVNVVLALILVAAGVMLVRGVPW